MKKQETKQLIFRKTPIIFFGLLISTISIFWGCRFGSEPEKVYSVEINLEDSITDYDSVKITARKKYFDTTKSVLWNDTIPEDQKFPLLKLKGWDNDSVIVLIEAYKNDQVFYELEYQYQNGEQELINKWVKPQTPYLSVTFNTPNKTVSERNVSLSGRIYSDYEIEKLLINDLWVDLNKFSTNQGNDAQSGPTYNISWDASYYLKQEGLNYIIAKVTDVEGNSASKSIQIYYQPPVEPPRDSIPPQITLISPKNYAVLDNSNITVRVEVYDKNELEYLKINGEKQTVPKFATSWGYQLQMQQGKNQVVVEAMDEFSNVSVEIFTFTYSPPSPPAKDTIPPSIEILMAPDTMNYGGEYEFKFMVKDNTNLTPHVEFMGKQVFPTGKFQYSVKHSSVQSGKNIITISAKDTTGNTSVATLEVHVKEKPSNGLSYEIVSAKNFESYYPDLTLKVYNPAMEKITVNGQNMVYDEFSDVWHAKRILSLGENKLSLLFTPASSTSWALIFREISIFRKPAFSALSVSTGTISPEFSPDEHNYTITNLPSSGYLDFFLKLFPGVMASPSKNSYMLTGGRQFIKISAVPIQGISSVGTTYNFELVPTGNPVPEEPKLKSFQFETYTFIPEFSPDTNSYEVYVLFQPTSVKVKAQPDNETHRVTSGLHSISPDTFTPVNVVDGLLTVSVSDSVGDDKNDYTFKFIPAFDLIEDK